MEIDYDPSVLTYGDLLVLFWDGHDPRRPSYSTQYRSAVFYRTEAERAEAEAARSRIEAGLGRVHTAIEPLGRFHRAEDYHQKYYLRGRPALAAEFAAIYPDPASFTDSTATARANGWVGGCGVTEQTARDIERLGLSAPGLAELRACLSRASGIACG